MNRKSFVSGSFYPNDSNELLKYFEHFSENLDTEKVAVTPKAVIVPHAGYIYSGFTANLAYYFSKQLTNRRCVVIGPSHRVYYEGASVSLHDAYETPLGEVAIDKAYANSLQEQFDFLSFEESMHHEHSTETQVPFVKHYLKQMQLVEIVYGKLDYHRLASLIEQCLEDDCFIVISTDLSHFYDLKEANALDNICLEAILKKDLTKFYDGCEACGIIGVKAMVEVAQKQHLHMELLNYCTSYDRTGDDSRVVGYTSFLIGEPKESE